MIKFNKQGIILVLTYLKELRRGERIDQHLSYLERPLVSGSSSRHAAFENSCLVVAEVEIRLRKCGRDGLLCKIHHALEESEESLARDFGLSQYEVERGIRVALKYISYKWPKNENYQKYRTRHR